MVYRFADQTVTVRPSDFLADNPDKSEWDFRELKELSDAIYLEQDRAENAQNKRNLSFNDQKLRHNFVSKPLDEEYIESQDRQYELTALSRLMESGVLTDVQKRRLLLHIVNGLTYREIGEREGVHYTSIGESISSALSKLKKFFD